MVRIRPGAFSCHQGAVLVLRAVAQANASKHPAETPLKKTLSRRMLPLMEPAMVTDSTTSAGVRQFTVKLEAILTRLWIWLVRENFLSTMNKSRSETISWAQEKSFQGDRVWETKERNQLRCTGVLALFIYRSNTPRKIIKLCMLEALDPPYRSRCM